MVEFFVPGTPKTAGSKRAFVVTPKEGKPRAIITDSVDTKGAGGDWRSAIQAKAQEAMRSRAPLTGPLVMELVFVVKRPQGHYRTNGELKNWAPFEWPTPKPDLTKLVRAVEDALKGICWRDDAQVVLQINEKRYSDDGRVGAWAKVKSMPPRGVAG